MLTREELRERNLIDNKFYYKVIYRNRKVIEDYYNKKKIIELNYLLSKLLK